MKLIGFTKSKIYKNNNGGQSLPTYNNGKTMTSEKITTHKRSQTLDIIFKFFHAFDRDCFDRETMFDDATGSEKLWKRKVKKAPFTLDRPMDGHINIYKGTKNTVIEYRTYPLTVEGKRIFEALSDNDYEGEVNGWTWHDIQDGGFRELTNYKRVHYRTFLIVPTDAFDNFMDEIAETGNHPHRDTLNHVDYVDAKKPPNSSMTLYNTLKVKEILDYENQQDDWGEIVEVVTGNKIPKNHLPLYEGYRYGTVTPSESANITLRAQT